MERISLARSDGTTIEFTPIRTNGLCALEETLGLTFGEIMTGLGINGVDRWSLNVTRQFLAACAPQGTSVETIGDVIDDVGFDGIGNAVNGLIWPARILHG